MKEKIDVFSPVTIFAFTSAFVGDIAFILALGVLIPIIGLVFFAFYLAFHYIAGGLATAILWHKTQGWLAKLMLLLVLILPLPLLCIGIVLAIILSNKFIAFITEQIVIQGVAVATGGAGEVLEGAVIAERTAEAAAAAARVARAARTAEITAEAARGARVAEGGVESAETGARAATKGTRATPSRARTTQEEIKTSVPGEESMPMEELEKRLVGEKPLGETPKEKGPFEKARKIKEKLEKFAPQQQGEEDEGEGDEEDEEEENVAA